VQVPILAILILLLAAFADARTHFSSYLRAFAVAFG